jgi:hypothetical protein
MKKYFSPICISIIISYLISCTNDQNRPVKTDENFRIGEDSTNIRIALQLFDHFNDHEWPAYASLYADSAKFLDPSFGKTEIIQSKEQTIKKYSDLQKVIPDIKDSLLSVNHAGQNTVVVEFISTGTLPDKSKLYLPICTVFKMNHGKIIEDHTYFDN